MPSRLILECPVSGALAEMPTDIASGLPELLPPDEDDTALPVGWGRFTLAVAVKNPAQAKFDALLTLNFNEQMAAIPAMLADPAIPEDKKAEMQAPEFADKVRAMCVELLSDKGVEPPDEDEPDVLYQTIEYEAIGPDAVSALFAALKAAGFEIKEG